MGSARGAARGGSAWVGSARGAARGGSAWVGSARGAARGGSAWVGSARGMARAGSVPECSASGAVPDPVSGVGGDTPAGGFSPESVGSSPRAVIVAASISPVGGSPTERWKSLSALRVRDPIAPSISPGSKPLSVSVSWTASTIGSYAASTIGPQQDRRMSSASPGNALRRGHGGHLADARAADWSCREAPVAPPVAPVPRVATTGAGSVACPCRCGRSRTGPAGNSTRTFTADIVASHRGEKVVRGADTAPAASRARRCACQRLSHSLNPHAMTKVRHR